MSETGEARHTSPRHALVTGATGALGPVLVQTLISEGWTVRALCRSAPQKDALPARVEIRLGDITDENAVAGAVDGVGTVFHLAGLLHNPRPRAADVPRYEEVNVLGTRHVARSAATAGASVIFFSTIALYGATMGEGVDESSPVKPKGPYALSKWRGEQVLLSMGPEATVLRLAAVYGRRIKGNYQRLVDAMRRGRFVPIGNGENRRTLVHEEDAIRAAILAADRVHEVRGLYNVTDGTTHTMREILAAIAAALGRPESRLRVPEVLARFGARAVGYEDVVDKYLENVEVKGDLIQKALGFSPRFNLADGWRHALRAPEPA